MFLAQNVRNTQDMYVYCAILRDYVQILQGKEIFCKCFEELEGNLGIDQVYLVY
jgi:hypothetical protein